MKIGCYCKLWFKNIFFFVGECFLLNSLLLKHGHSNILKKFNSATTGIICYIMKVNWVIRQLRRLSSKINKHGFIKFNIQHHSESLLFLHLVKLRINLLFKGYRLKRLSDSLIFVLSILSRTVYLKYDNSDWWKVPIGKFYLVGQRFLVVMAC